MRILFDLRVPVARIISREIVGEEGKDENAKMFSIIGKYKTVLIPINRKLVKYIMKILLMEYLEVIE